MTQCVTFGIRHIKAQVRKLLAWLVQSNLTFPKTLMEFESVMIAKVGPPSDRITIGCVIFNNSCLTNSERFFNADDTDL